MLLEVRKHFQFTAVDYDFSITEELGKIAGLA